MDWPDRRCGVRNLGQVLGTVNPARDGKKREVHEMKWKGGRSRHLEIEARASS